MRGIVLALERAGVDYALVGAFALAIHGAPRATTDIDLLVRPEDLQHALDAVRPLGFTFLARPMSFQSGVSMQRVSKVMGEDVLMVDFLLAQPPLMDAWQSRMAVEAFGAAVRVVNREQLLKMKALSGRLSDLADIERLQERNNE